MSTPIDVPPLTDRTAVVTGGTDGIGAATARALRDRGAAVVVIGRSSAKAAALEAEAAGAGSLRAVVADFSSMAAVRRTVAEHVGPIDLLVHAVGVLLTRAAYTAEGIEKDFAISYLSRFAFLEAASERGLLTPGTRMVNIAASSRTVPRIVRMEFADLAVVKARTGMRAHGQAQLANDLLTARAHTRYGISAVGYGPGAVDTSIRREVPSLVQAVMRPFYARATRRPEAVATDLVALLTDPGLGPVTFADRRGRFPAADFVADLQRQTDLVAVSEALLAEALSVRT